MSPRTHDERGELLQTPVVAMGACGWCDGPMPIRAKGRPPKFCSVTCRKALHAAVRRLEVCTDNLRIAQAQLAAAQRATAGRSTGDMLRERVSYTCWSCRDEGCYRCS